MWLALVALGREYAKTHPQHHDPNLVLMGFICLVIFGIYLISVFRKS